MKRRNSWRLCGAVLLVIVGAYFAQMARCQAMSDALVVPTSYSAFSCVYKTQGGFIGVLF